MKNNLAYICGPITGVQDDNITAFKVASKTVERLGYNSIIPHDIFNKIDTTSYTHSDYMRKCIRLMMSCDIVFTLTDWYESKGATIEVDLARKLDIPVVSIIAAHNYNLNSI